MYRQASNQRKHSTTPIVRVTVDANGKEQEEIVLCITNMPKAEGNAFAKELVKLMNAGLDKPDYVVEVHKLVLEGRLLGAIKHYKDNTGCSLREAKEFVDDLRNSKC